MKEIEVYNTYSSYLKDKFGEKVYKLPISLPLTCPNRDGNLGVNGCIFCGEEGGSFDELIDVVMEALGKSLGNKPVEDKEEVEEDGEEEGLQ